ncbi:MAG: hypothetical protein ACYC61_29575 [Isosphaeraceae bacterium]
MSRPSIVGASLVVLAVAAAVGCGGNPPAAEPALITPEPALITPESARAALLRLESLQWAGGGVIDPFAELKTGAIVSTGGSNVTIGRFFSCDLKKKTWRMDFSNGRTGKAAFACGASGRFEWHDGIWEAIETESSITCCPGRAEKVRSTLLAAQDSRRTGECPWRLAGIITKNSIVYHGMDTR